jgi:hypothetical protein
MSGEEKGWTHAICVGCWMTRNPDRVPVTLTEPKIERCCFCGNGSAGGIYVRAAPTSVPLCKGHDHAS